MEWRRVDLHIHTPGSKDYKDSNATYLDILTKAEAEGLDVIAFTDHNTIAGYAAMQREISDLERWEAASRLQPAEKKRLADYRRLTSKILVLPGIELTATFGFHVLGIFPDSSDVRTIEHALLQMNVPPALLDGGETEVGPTCDVLTAYRVLNEAGALVIAAHANSSHGVAMFGLDIGGQTRIAYTQDPNLHALEVTDLQSNRRRKTASFFNGSKPQYPRRMHCIQGSDAHLVTGQGKNLGVGERTTEVLLPEVSFQELKNVFLGNDFSRTRPYTKAAEPVDPVQNARTEGATLVQSFHEQMSRQGGRLHAVLRDVVAFANTNGGTIYVGVSSNAKTPPKGIENVGSATTELRTSVERLITPPLDVELNVSKSAGVDVIDVVVPRGDQRPYVLEGSKIYIRKEAETGLAQRDEILSLVKQVLRDRDGWTPPASGQTDKATDEKAEQAARPRRSRSTSLRSAAPSSRTEPTPKQAVSSTPSEAGDAEQPKAAPEQPSVPARAENLATDPPRTGVEIAESVERKGVVYHTMRDLRDGGEVQNVTRVSARRLWRYAIALKEKGTFSEIKVNWTGDLGLWHKYFRAGRPHYDLVQRDNDGGIHIYYGVTEDGISGPWKAVVGIED